MKTIARLQELQRRNLSPAASFSVRDKRKLLSEGRGLEKKSQVQSEEFVSLFA